MPYVTEARFVVGGAEERVAVQSWAEVQALIERLGRQDTGYLLLYGERVQQPAVMIIEFDSTDQETPWSCHVHRPQWTHLVLNPKALRIEVDGVRLPLQLVRRAAQAFFETGKRKRSLIWGRAAVPLTKMSVAGAGIREGR